MEKMYETFMPPFRYDKAGQMIFDANNNLCLDVRGWGLFQKKENGLELQDSWGEFVVEAINHALEEKEQ
jgi:hypothetical protein